MLLTRNIIFSNSILIISALATKKENDWVLPNGRQILENENMKKFVISDRSKIILENWFLSNSVIKNSNGVIIRNFEANYIKLKLP